jgi:predicted metalloprotease
MDFDDQSVDTSQLEDRRGMGVGPGLAVGGGGLGIIGLLIYLAINLLGGGSSNFALSPDQAQGGASAGEVSERCNQQGAIDQYEDCFVLKVFNEVNEVWAAEFEQAGQRYREPRLVYFEQAASTGCGSASSQVGPFYCPADQRVYIDLGFLDQLQQEFGAEGRPAQAYIVAHEVGHHLQNLTGTERQVRQAQQRNPSQTNALSIRLELQADCYAGAWSGLADKRGNVSISEAELDNALRAAEAVGDDRIQQKTQGQVNPETWTHGSAEQRRSWFLKGFRSADTDGCDTFSS